MPPSNFETLQIALTQAQQYPTNLKPLNGLCHRTSLEGELQRRSSKLFCDEIPVSPRASRPEIQFVELDNLETGSLYSDYVEEAATILTYHGTDYIPSLIVNAADLKHHLQLANSSRREEPIQRLM